MAPVSLHWNDGTPENVVVLPCLKSMTWAMENKNSAPGNRVAVINLKVLLYIYLFTTFFCVSMIAVCVGADDSLHLIFELADDGLHLISELQVSSSVDKLLTDALSVAHLFITILCMRICTSMCWCKG
ncbi:hypothetical protein L3X38_026474 [Prunus dulcis]|uniref:Uncharacterized protein n=2 Tax=Prunus TaxID=3754 RepID=A0AAD4VLA2_PRUDU|nr:hypothetical protein L3X38_026474 [Prunus dulcis]